MKTKGDTVTCSQASKSYYQIADHSSAIEWSACFCGEKEQQNCYQQENLQCFLPHLHHLPSHEMRWDFGGLTTEVTVSRIGHYIILRRTLSTLRKPPRRVFTHAGGVASFYSNERHYHLLQQQLPRNVGAGGAPLHRLTAVPLALSGEASLCCNVCYGSPERVELSGGQFDSVKSSLDSWPR